MAFKITGLTVLNAENPSCFQVMLAHETNGAQFNFRVVIPKNAYDLTIREIEEHSKAEAKKLAEAG
ncbi:MULTISPECIES: hypothetical protein [Pseudomonas]|uniref:Uncharacterized protein n=1 Tax=Pseudomonas lactis TaxID=1615674 RepID=A0A921T6E7_9PSED|nr:MULTISPECIES: hypothetical protein [Pseudomonas]HJH17654.1 hypothetical protein [Pseudomonas lactis]